ncbi:hypothetical protein D3C80_1234700 [compost metagenome]
MVFREPDADDVRLDHIGRRVADVVRAGDADVVQPMLQGRGFQARHTRPANEPLGQGVARMVGHDRRQGQIELGQRNVIDRRLRQKGRAVRLHQAFGHPGAALHEGWRQEGREGEIAARLRPQHDRKDRLDLTRLVKQQGDADAAPGRLPCAPCAHRAAPLAARYFCAFSLRLILPLVVLTSQPGSTI